MMADREKQDTLINRQNISYYDAIAAEYDAILEKEETNSIVRAKVAAWFKSSVKSGYVLDFGGGTGQDLGWLLAHPYQVIFCEPSASMRRIAVERGKYEFPDIPVSFLDDSQTDFRNWSAGFPFMQKVYGVLANFAVLNCIPDLELFFEKMAIVTLPGGMVIALLLDNSLIKRLRSNLKGTLRSFFSGEPVHFEIEYKGERQLVYIHSVRAIRRSLAGKFELKHVEQLSGFGFCLIQLIRK
jgi:SAM-dependent methyltransferase